MKPVKLIFCIGAMLINQVPLFGQRLEPFLASPGRVKLGNQAEQAPYDRTVGLFDFIPEGSMSDTIAGDTSYFFAHFISPIELQEIGIRVISPIPQNCYPAKGDYETERYSVNPEALSLYFNPRIRVEFWGEIASADTSVKTFGWSLLNHSANSRSGPVKANEESGKAELRIYSVPLNAGHYRVMVTDADNGKPSGSYLLQVGTVPGIKSIKAVTQKNDLFGE
jgi:hypothetical protein